jgi:hypothetical protein
MQIQTSFWFIIRNDLSPMSSLRREWKDIFNIFTSIFVEDHQFYAIYNTAS